LLSSLIGCATLIPPVTPRTQTFHEAEYAPYTMQGEGSISGESCTDVIDGRTMKLPERAIYLWPASPYVTEHLNNEMIEKDTLWFAPDARIYHYRRATTTDKAGRFRFDKLPPGEYYLTCLFEWEIPRYHPRGPATGEAQAKWLMMKVSLQAGENVRLGVIGPLPPEPAPHDRQGERSSGQPRQRFTVLAGLLFQSGQAVLKEEAQKALDEVIARLKELGPGVLRIQGHTDNVPIGDNLKREFADNWALSKARAASAARYLMDKGQFQSVEIVIEGFADTRAVATNDSEEGRQQNRRIEIIHEGTAPTGNGAARETSQTPDHS
jgi:outer membrane protein OmpA-like peptidoglycan-associated protein